MLSLNNKRRICKPTSGQNDSPHYISQFAIAARRRKEKQRRIEPRTKMTVSTGTQTQITAFERQPDTNTEQGFRQNDSPHHISQPAIARRKSKQQEDRVPRKNDSANRYPNTNSRLWPATRYKHRANFRTKWQSSSRYSTCECEKEERTKEGSVQRKNDNANRYPNTNFSLWPATRYKHWANFRTKWQSSSY